MICPLVTFHLDEECGYRWPIDEPNVPVLFLVHARPQIQRLGHLMNQLVLRISDIDDEWRVIVMITLRFCLALDWRG